MAKRRRKPNNRQRPQASRGAVRTAEVADAPETAPGRDAGDGGPGSKAVRERGPASAGHLARAEKKELARRQREEVRKRVRRAEAMRRLRWIAGGAVVIAAAVLWFSRDTGPAERPDTLPGELRTTSVPWPPNAADAAERADLIGLPGHDGDLAMHEHADVQVFVNGEPAAIPVNVGIDDVDGDVESVHTHSGDGVVHIESNAIAEFTLGQFFDVWGVRLSATCLGGFCESGEDTLQVFVGGEEVTTGIRSVPLDDQTVIVVTFGTADELPDPIPSTFDFSTVQP